MDESSDSENESFVTIGTPLEPYGENEGPKKPFGLEQTVKDSKGRARFHGAFTGGYSAGYFNTVGSKEGFTPSLFLSSRDKKNDTNIQRPEDFMDDEDFSEHGIAPKSITAKDDFKSKNRKRKETLNEDPLKDLIVPSSLSMGLKLLRQLGWKEGQGIGPRISKSKQINYGTEKKVYGCALPGNNSEGSEVDDFIPKNATFAPKDVNPIKFIAKDNFHGHGYSGINVSGALLQRNESSLPSKGGSLKGNRGITGHAFGVGEYEDEDDVDVYALDSMTNYDTILTDPQSNKNYGWTAPKHKGLSAAPVGYIGKVLEGFKLSNHSLKPKKNFSPPQLPRNFKPFHVDTTQEKPDAVQHVEVKNMNANVRRNMIGEVNSVFDMISSDDKLKIAAAKNQPTTDQLSKTRFDSQKHISKKESSSSFETIQTVSSSKDIHTFKPFAKDQEKQARYERYCEDKKKGKSDDIPDGTMTEWERSKELHEFTRAAALFKPMSSLMSSRFTSAKYDDSDKTIEVPANEMKDKSDQQNAADMKMFGKLTRERFEWHPDKVLCKRFNVANPYPDSTLIGVPKVKRDKFSIFNFLNNPTANEMEVQSMEKKEAPEVNFDTTKAQKIRSADLKPLAILASDDTNLQSTSSKSSTEQQTHNVNDNQESLPTKSTERPSMDIFKAIFSDSEDNSSSESEDESSAKDSINTNATEVAPKPSMELTSIFGKQSAFIIAQKTTNIGTIPIESLQDRLSPQTQNQSLSTHHKEQDTIIVTAESTNLTKMSDKTDEGVWAERVLTSEEESDKKKHKHKHKLKKKKSKHRKHKTKHKKEKKKKKKKKEVIVLSSDSSVSDADSDSDSSTDQKLLHKLKSFQGNRRATAADFM